MKSNKFLGNSIELFISKDSDTRVKKERLILESDGVYDDKFKGKDIQRSVLLVSLESYKIAEENGINLCIGDLGENILVDFDLYSLELGTKLQVGNVIMQTSQKSSLCPSLSKISSKLPKLLKSRRGVFAKVICSGNINKGDSISYA